jgi:outer membrane murein-binding lipoprotein Lpp
MFEKNEDIDSVIGQSTISGSIKEMKNIKAISAAIHKIESEVDRLSADVQATKQKVVQGANIDNFVEFQAKLSDSTVASIKSITVKIDGYNVYDLNEISGFWMPSGKLPIYAGPLQPGSHRVDLEAKMVMKRKGNMAVNSDIYRIINKSFTVLIPTTSFKKRWVMNIIPPKSEDGQPVIKVSKIKID